MFYKLKMQKHKKKENIKYLKSFKLDETTKLQQILKGMNY